MSSMAVVVIPVIESDSNSGQSASVVSRCHLLTVFELFMLLLIVSML